MKNKSSLIDLFLQRSIWRPHPIHPEQLFDAATIWSAIRDLDDGYDKANCVVDYAYLFNDEVAGQAYHAILDMTDRCKIRALGGIYSKMDAPHKAEILSFILQEFASGSSEAAYRLKFIRVAPRNPALQGGE